MTRLEVLEDTWEELAARAEEFKGRKLRLIVLPSETEAVKVSSDEVTLREIAVRLFAEADSIEREPGRLSNDPYKKKFGEIVAEKYRKMGLKL